MAEDLRKLRVRFQRALLGLLRTDDRNSEFLALEETLRALGALAGNFEAAAVWTRCREWIESLRTSEERPKPGYIRFLRMVDQSLKIWLDNGQAHFESREIPKLRAELEALTRGEAQSAEPGPPVPARAARGELEEPDQASARARNESNPDSEAAMQEPAPAEMRSVLSGLAAHPAWEETRDAGADESASAADSIGGRADDADAGDQRTSPVDRREAKDRVPLSNVLPRLERIVIQAGRDLAKPVELVLGEGGYVDRSVLKKLLLPLEQIVRNAIYHGIEGADERAAAAKPRIGVLLLTLRRSGGRARIEIETDGLAIDFDRLRRKAEQMDLLVAGRVPSRDELLNALTAPGFSTAHSATQMAGYGVGLDAAQTAVEELGGELEIKERQGAILRFAIHLPAGCCGPSELSSV